MPIQNKKASEHTFLQPLLADTYFPKHLVGKGQALLHQLAERIEREAPEGEAVYELTRATAEAFNELQEEFLEAGSEIETVARDAIGSDVEFVLKAYGYDVDTENAIANRDWLCDALREAIKRKVRTRRAASVLAEHCRDLTGGEARPPNSTSTIRSIVFYGSTTSNSCFVSIGNFPGPARIGHRTHRPAAPQTSVWLLSRDP
jgi:hypothetical protein